MKKGSKPQLNTHTKTRNTKELEWHSFDNVFRKSFDKKDFREGYEEEMSRIKLAKRIKEIRTNLKLTQVAVARRVSMPQSVIARLESGQHSVSVDTLSRVAHALGKNLEIV